MADSHCVRLRAIGRSIGQFWIALVTTPPALTALAIALLAILLARIYVFNSMPEGFHHAYDIGLLTENLSEATIAAYIFFVLSFQLPQVIEKQRVGRAMTYWVDRIVEDVIRLVSQMYALHGGYEKGKRLSLLEVTPKLVKQLFENIGPLEPCGMAYDTKTFEQPTWFQVMLEYDSKCRNDISEVMKYARFIDAEFVELISALQQSAYTRSLQFLSEIYNPGQTDMGKNLGFIANEYFGQFQIVMELAKQCEKFRKTYRIT